MVMALMTPRERLMPRYDKWRYRAVYLMMATISACNTAARFYDDVHAIYLVGEIAIHIFGTYSMLGALVSFGSMCAFG